jgi:hypothetical protein
MLCLEVWRERRVKGKDGKERGGEGRRVKGNGYPLSIIWII